MENKINKRGQITIFIILALAIVIVLVLILLRGKDFTVIAAPKTPIENVKQCAILALKDSAKIISSQGGSLEPQHYYLFNGTKIEYLCYATEDYKTCIMQKPMLKESFERELKKDIEPKIKECLDIQKSSLEKNGYSVSYKYPNVTISLVPGNILIEIESDLKISKSKTESYKTIKIAATSKLYELIMITSSILNWEARYGESEIMNYMMYYPELRVEKKKQDEGTTIYIITDKDTEEQFAFASRSFVLPIGVTGK